jgi:hypothetical protein
VLPCRWLLAGYPRPKTRTFVPRIRNYPSVRDRGVVGSNPIAPTTLGARGRRVAATALRRSLTLPFTRSRCAGSLRSGRRFGARGRRFAATARCSAPSLMPTYTSAPRSIRTPARTNCRTVSARFRIRDRIVANRRRRHTQGARVPKGTKTPAFGYRCQGLVRGHCRSR